MLSPMISTMTATQIQARPFSPLVSATGMG
jgi:hypothetical protein